MDRQKVKGYLVNVEVAGELAQLSRDLNQVQMMFVITVGLMIIFASITLSVIINQAKNTKRDDDERTRLIKLLERQVITNAKMVKNLQAQQQLYEKNIRRFFMYNSNEHKKIASLLKQLVMRISKYELPNK